MTEKVKNDECDVSKKSIKKRTWTAVVYPESLPDNWKDILRKSGVECAVSPVHDRDVNPDGSLKKAHYHLILAYRGPTTESSVRDFICGQLHGARPEPLESVKGMYKYFTHAENPEKVQYDSSEIMLFNDFDPADFLQLTTSQRNQVQRELLQLIRDEKIFEYSDLCYLLLDTEKFDHLAVASSQTIFFTAILRSLRGKRNEQRRERFNQDTGEYECEYE